MRVIIAAIGRPRPDPVEDLFQDYLRRCPWTIQVVDVVPRDGPRARRAEAEALRAAVPGGAVVVALDARGRSLTSEGFADRLGAWRDDGRAVAFLIGGADGLDPELRRRADLVLAFGTMTWPHRLVRVMLAEQLYRASTIHAGHPYHRA
jgi:23S rRNA (pseudouridine1915-N3)-methyltransferase